MVKLGRGVVVPAADVASWVSAVATALVAVFVVVLILLYRLAQSKLRNS